ncbi:MAG: site-2 protease family protein [Clostridia bacterium]|nr:site-2 protease family protein [Clostridia bacterium]
MNTVIYYILSAIAALIALTIHEYCHGYAAYKLGDDTAKNLGRLTLNPIKHIDPYGALCMIFFHFGWAKPVPINARNFRDPRKGFAITAAAGPAANLILGFITAPFLLLSWNAYVKMAITTGGSGFAVNLLSNLTNFLSAFHVINVGLGLFNLLPIPPFDGSRLLYVFLPPKYYFGIMKHEKKIYIGVLLWLLLGDYVCDAIRMLPVIKAGSLLYKFAGIFSLSGMISSVISGASNLMLDFWQLFIK